MSAVPYGGMLSGCKTLREMKTFSKMYDERTLDTTLHDVLVALGGEARLHHAIVIKSDEYPYRLCEYADLVPGTLKGYPPPPTDKLRRKLRWPRQCQCRTAATN